MYTAHNIYLVAFQEILWKGFMIVGGVGFLLCLVIGWIAKDK